jgi:hypothetical protein
MASRREHWGTYVTQDGEQRHMIRGARNRTWFENDAGEVVSPVQTNVYPAMVWMYAETDWFEPGNVMLSIACRDEVRAKVRYKA